MKLSKSGFLLAVAFAAVTLMAAGQVAASVSVAPQPAFQGTRPTPPGSGGGGAFQGTRPTPPGSGGGGASAF